MKSTLLAATLAALIASPASAAGIIERACMSSERSGATALLCNCIQAVADELLAPHEQRKGAAFFSDPHKSQETRMSKNRSDSEFWEKWTSYGDKAAQLCN
ncbi:MAG: hypothetical protein ACU0CY_13405 [Maritimibacter harenae]|jgi:opacity protein-like surface antigen|uniref:Arginine transporter n=1 Tax=Maritimibacter harenae TaxID=2606218 RepID=A0A845M9D5_9RHOB|nr:hypothetical protein [Maritimibacter harenae]MZR14647.1 hypothetical protein [Maritimibacter harenae]